MCTVVYWEAVNDGRWTACSWFVFVAQFSKIIERIILKRCYDFERWFLWNAFLVAYWKRMFLFQTVKVDLSRVSLLLVFKMKIRNSRPLASLRHVLTEAVSNIYFFIFICPCILVILACYIYLFVVVKTIYIFVYWYSLGKNLMGKSW